MKDTIKALGRLNIKRFDIKGMLVQEEDMDNLVVTTGLNLITAKLHDTVNTAQIGWLAVGTGSVAAAFGNTALGTELSRVALATAGGVVTANSTVYTATFAAGTGTGAWTEAGLFAASSGGTMLSRTVFSVINKGASDSITVTWTLVIA